MLSFWNRNEEKGTLHVTHDEQRLTSGLARYSIKELNTHRLETQ